MTEVGLIALVMTFVIVTGGIDLSVGSILGMTAILLGVFWKNVGLPLPVAIGLGLVVGTFAGFVNGVIITRFRVPPLIATLGTLALYRGIAEGVSQARSVRGYPDWFYVLGQGQVLGVPTQLWLLGIVAVARRDRPRLHHLGPHHLRHRLERGRGALLRPAASTGPRSRSTPPPASPRPRRRRSSSPGSRPPARTWAPASSSTPSPPSSSAAPRSSAAAAPSSARSSASILIQALKNGLSLAGVKSDGTVVLIGAVLILTILVSNLFHRDGNR